MGNANSSGRRSSPNRYSYSPDVIVSPMMGPPPPGYPEIQNMPGPPPQFSFGQSHYPVRQQLYIMPQPQMQTGNFYPLPYNSQWPVGNQAPPNFTSGPNMAYGSTGESSHIPAATAPPAPIAELRTATIRNEVNIKRSTLKLERDPTNQSQFLVSFSFDATKSGSICIFFLAQEGDACSFTPKYPLNYTASRQYFSEGLSQRFCQTPGTGVDLSKFSEAELSKVSLEVYPLVVRTETVLRDPPQGSAAADSTPGGKLPGWVQSQLTYAVLEKHADGEWVAKVIKQKMWVEGTRYELQEIYGIENATVAGDDSSDVGKECVICMSEPRDTTVLPCRHMCMCSECATVLRFQTNRCPICRQVIERLLEIKASSSKSSNPTVAPGEEAVRSFMEETKGEGALDPSESAARGIQEMEIGEANMLLRARRPPVKPPVSVDEQ